MSRKYDDAFYGLLERLELKGHQTTTAMTSNTQLNRYYPGPGAIFIKKFGVRHMGDAQGATEVTFSLTDVNGTLATIVASTSTAAWNLASKSVNATIAAGSYFSIISAGTAKGSVACFIDYRRDFSTPDKWKAYLTGGGWTHPPPITKERGNENSNGSKALLYPSAEDGLASYEKRA